MDTPTAASSATEASTDGSASPTASAVGAAHPTANLWACLRTPVNRVEAARALLGLDTAALRQLGASEMLTTPVTGHLLDNGHRILDQPGFPHQHLDLAAEVAAGLRVLNAAGAALEVIPTWAYDDERLRHARGALARSQALAAHSAFHEADVIKAAANRTSSMFSDSALGLGTLVPLVDTRTMAQHHVLLLVLSYAAEIGIRPDLEIADGIAFCGHIGYRHGGNRGHDGPSGIRVGSLLIDVPDYRGEPSAVALDRLRQRAGKRTAILVTDPSEMAKHESIIRAEISASVRL